MHAGMSVLYCIGFGRVWWLGQWCVFGGGGASQPQHLVHFPKLQTLQLTYCTIACSTPSHSLQDSNTKKGGF